MTDSRFLTFVSYFCLALQLVYNKIDYVINPHHKWPSPHRLKLYVTFILCDSFDNDSHGMADPQSEKFHNSVECNSKEISEDAGPGNGSCTY